MLVFAYFKDLHSVLIYYVYFTCFFKLENVFEEIKTYSETIYFFPNLETIYFFPNLFLLLGGDRD